MTDFLNISAYRFVSLPDAPALGGRLRDLTRSLGLKGTILLAEEGINLVLAGSAEAIGALLAELGTDPRLAGLPVKESWSASQPFGRMLVKVKREIIRMNHPAIRPADGRAPAVDAGTLKRWLDQGHDDQGRAVVTLDTRNAFEVDQGAFENCIDWRLTKFSDFPEAVRAHGGNLRGKTVVSYCTGGIRCEKAAIHLRDAGIDNVYQLDGGILKYFELAGGEHYRGGCFVFDERTVLGPDLAPMAASSA